MRKSWLILKETKIQSAESDVGRKGEVRETGLNGRDIDECLNEIDCYFKLGETGILLEDGENRKFS